MSGRLSVRSRYLRSASASSSCVRRCSLQRSDLRRSNRAARTAASAAIATATTAAGELRGVLGRGEALDRRVRAQLVGVIAVDGDLRAGGEGDHVAVPGGELFERSQQLLALGAAGGAAEALLGLAVGQLEPLEADLSGLARLLGARPRAGDDELGRRGGVEVGREIDVARQAQPLEAALRGRV